ncbi:glycosyltransferase [Dyadobacter psychrophilus]|uniref:UDP-N-acetylglucosamine transferase subunit ALG13 n=1 Tax=Dyadobacter psychrophilus TaxID=651661 RepID=A0A1T5HEB1_9BACT|nr:glycosyltransferase [Dyadobacter psychrophilus]SKC18996.1 UDP-N-acetylglucosamine transferase subunit ALG13 [Dyadobacter psychrophilus]
MIFVTVGTQGPFDRLISIMDHLAKDLPEISFVAQTSKGNYMVKNMKSFNFIDPIEFDKYFSSAKLIVSHAGMGTIISAMQYNKPIIVFPKLAKLGEHRNDHQLATAKKLERLNYLHVAYSEQMLREKILNLMRGELNPLHTVGNYASSELINSLQNFISV